MFKIGRRFLKFQPKKEYDYIIGKIRALGKICERAEVVWARPQDESREMPE